MKQHSDYYNYDEQEILSQTWRCLTNKQIRVQLKLNVISPELR